MSINTVDKFFKNNSALIVVDMQNDFYIGGSLEVKSISEIIKPIRELLHKAVSEDATIIFTRDEHPANHISFKEWPVHCVKDTDGSLIIDELNFYRKDMIISKGTDPNIENYSCFYNGSDFSRLKNFLEDNNITTLYFVGVVGEYCIKHSAIDAINLNFDVYLVKDAICCIDENFDLNAIDKKIKVI